MNLLNTFFQGPLFYLIIIWSLIWKGLALWRAAKNDHQIWFIALLIFNTAGILEILYYFIFGKKKIKTKTTVISNQ
ncbi:MAG: DUF5652 family protein [Patescibacteria group bacterium]